jgi:G3E family GTPase
MKILLVGGFLGSGKTTIIRALIQGMIEAGETCAIIENEIGEIGIDDALLAEASLEVTPLFGGCVCCEISGSLVTAIERINEEIKPDWLIVEMTGLALLGTMRTTLRKYLRKPFCIHTLSIVDVSRWNLLTGALVYIFSNQIEDADMVLLNKIDIVAPDETVYSGIKERCPNGIILEINTQKTAPAALWDNMKKSLGIHWSEANHAS